MIAKHIKRKHLYWVWNSMKQRCYNKNSAMYKHYGGRGITVCESWMEFENFLNDMGDRPHPTLYLDRINNDGGYCKANCRWATVLEQVYNRRCTIKVPFRGELVTTLYLALVSGIKRDTIDNRLRSGLTAEQAISRPLKKRRK